MGTLYLPPPARTPPGMQVMFENGSSFVYVDGTCRYWAWTFATEHFWSEVRTGVLEPHAERDLIARLQYAAWRGWSGDHHSRAGVFDADLLVLMPDMTIDKMVRCFDGCVDEPTPAPLRAVASQVRDIAGDLWALGAPVSGDVRFVLVREEVDAIPLITYYDWPLSIDPSSVAIGEIEAAMMAWGGGRLASRTDAHALRSLRATYRDTSTAEWLPHVPVKDREGNRYHLFFRDTIPYEDEQGLIRPK